ncbi:MAG: hypothetical protein SVW57_00780 [Thermodesulfobacteriota bacterium]|nr:hypothetical protein [Thermodesulfobacteriota bacterium]
MNDTEVQLARLADNLEYIIDSDGQRVEFDDPRVIHIQGGNNSPYSIRLVENLYKRSGRKCRFTGRLDAEAIQYAKKLCSGRECVPCMGIAGATAKDVYEKHYDSEIALYFTLDQQGPCQNGAWPVVWDSFAKRLNVGNAIFGIQPNRKNNFFGLSPEHMKGTATATIVGHFLDEAENALKCLAQDKHAALETFEAETNTLIESILKGTKAFELALKQWADKMSLIPLTATVKETPKVLIFGGLNLLFVHRPVTDFFIEQGILPKVVDLAEGTTWIASEPVMRFGFKKGLVSPKKQFKMIPLVLASLPGRKNRDEAVIALRARLGISFIDRLMGKYREIMEKSGLMFDKHVVFADLAEAGHEYATYNGFTETPVTTGRFLCSVKDGLFDGLVNMGSFNCQPAMNSQAIIRPLANVCDVPYAAIDCEGPSITANQKRLLETIAVQAKRIRQEKNERGL